jgi:hypothetical protein
VILSQFCFCIAAYDTFTQNMIETIFHHFNFSQKRSKISDCIFWKFFYKRKFSFSFISCTRNRHSTMIENYIRKNNVIKCEFDLAFTEKLIHYLIFTRDCRETLIDSHRLLSRRTLCWENNYSIFKRRRNWINLSLINNFVKSSIIIWSINT